MIHPAFIEDFRKDERSWLRDWCAKTFKTTWYIRKWNNVDQDGSDINNKPFGGTELIKGLFGKLLFGIGRSYEIDMIMGEQSPYKGVYCSKLPYSPYKKAIMVHIDKKKLEELCKSDDNKFKCTYNYYYGG